MAADAQTELPRLEPHSEEYERLRIRLLTTWGPPTAPCKDCGGPVIVGYCCDRCGSIEPR